MSNVHFPDAPALVLGRSGDVETSAGAGFVDGVHIRNGDEYPPAVFVPAALAVEAEEDLKTSAYHGREPGASLGPSLHSKPGEKPSLTNQSTLALTSETFRIGMTLSNTTLTVSTIGAAR